MLLGKNSRRYGDEKYEFVNFTKKMRVAGKLREDPEKKICKGEDKGGEKGRSL